MWADNSQRWAKSERKKYKGKLCLVKEESKGIYTEGKTDDTITVEARIVLKIDFYWHIQPFISIYRQLNFKVWTQARVVWFQSAWSQREWCVQDKRAWWYLSPITHTHTHIPEETKSKKLEHAFASHKLTTQQWLETSLVIYTQNTHSWKQNIPLFQS